MATSAYKKNFALIDWSNTPPLRRRPLQTTPARSDLAFPMVIRDHIAPTFNPADGRTYESANAFKHGVKEAGKRAGKEYEIVGNDKSFTEPKFPDQRPDPSLKHDIKAAYDKVVGT